MSFQIERGLFMLDFSDYHSILGVSVEADVKEIRKNYLKIARRLHPDSGVLEGENDRQLASQFLSKMVNPAWEQLSQERSRTDHAVLLKLKGQGAMRHQTHTQVLGSLAKQLLTANNLDYFYRTALQDLADRQYQHLDQTLELIAQISELNLVYLARKEGPGSKSTISEPKKPLYAAATPAPTAAPTAPPAPNPSSAQEQRESLLEQYYRRAEGFMKKGNYAQSTLELRDALQIDPNHSRCHSLMGMVYLQQKQGTMAKIHFNKALTVNPEDPTALEGKKYLEQQANKATSPGTAAKPANNANSKSDRNKPDGGLFGGLFSGKKK